MRRHRCIRKLSSLNNFEYAKQFFLDGLDLLQKDKYQEAELKFLESLKLLPDRASTLTNLSAAQIKLKKFSDAKISSKQAITLEANNGEALLNLGLIEKECGNLIGATDYFNQAIELNQNHVEAYLNIGATLKDLRHYSEALSAYEKALSIKPDYAEAWFHKGALYGELKLYSEALSAYEKALQIKPDIDYLLGQYIHTKLLIANWDKLEPMVSSLIKQIQSGLKVSTPFNVLSALDLSDIHLRASKIWINDRYPPNFLLPKINKIMHQKIRIGYFSADFCNHPVSLLTSELFKLHSRDTFKVVAFSLKNAGPNDLIRKHLIDNFDQFIDVENKSDLEIAELSRSMEIDIAIDLGGHTQGSRTGIFSYRAAPIQVNYLGYPGSMGAEYIDYLIADKTLIPEQDRISYQEKIVYLPNTYIIDDRDRRVGHKRFERKDFGLPDCGIVFCAFNSAYKFNQRMLESWSRILLKTRGSVLWISENNAVFRENLLNTFSSLGINSDRIVFATRLETPEDHLARHKLADLFLDTSPYNAHTTALDSLKSGLPVLTLMGEGFAGRVGASVVNAIGLPDLVTYSHEEYELKAIALSSIPEELNKIKARLKTNFNTKPLFNSPLFTAHIEAAYIKMYERYQADLGPDHILINEP